MSSLSNSNTGSLSSLHINLTGDDEVDLTGPLVRHDANPPALRDYAQTGGDGQYLSWVITWNNAEATLRGMSIDNTKAYLWQVFEMKKGLNIRYMAWCLEEGESGTPHYQIFLQLKSGSKMRHQTIRNKLKDLKLWIEPCRDPGAARDYCLWSGKHEKKAGKLLEGPWIHGNWETQQGRRTDIVSFADRLQAGDSIKKAALADPSTYIKHHAGLEKFFGLVSQVKRSWMTELHILTGPPGTGKSHTAREEAETFIKEQGLDEDVYYWRQPTKAGDKYWFHGYEGQATMIIEEFYGTVTLDFMKILVDKYPCKVEVKNGHREFLVKKIWITSNRPWSIWWGTETLNDTQKRAFERRITSERELTQVYREPSAIADDFFGDIGSGFQLEAPALPPIDEEEAMFARLAERRNNWDGGNYF